MPQPVLHGSPDEGRTITRLTAIFWLLGLCLALLQAWAHRFSLSSEDAVSYLDIGDAYLKGDWGSAINAYWSPLYSWLLGFFVALLRPSRYWEFPVVKLVNLVIFLVAFASFDFFLKQLLIYQQTTDQTTNHRLLVRKWVWLILGYALFLWASLICTGVHLDAPDNLTAACAYLASGLMLRMQTRTTGRMTYLLFGIALGFGYLSKTVMFPLAFVYLAAILVMTSFDAASTSSERPRLFRMRHGLRYDTAFNLFAGLLAFALVSAPFVAALSVAKGRLTFGDSGKLNYFWYINRSNGDKHWQGKQPHSGIPEHPTRRIFDRPDAFEFRNPVGGTNPTWFDPSYWHEGLRLHFDLRQQLRAVSRNLREYLKLFLGALFLGYFPLLLAGGDVHDSLRRLKANWFIWLPGVAGLGCYMLATDMSGGFVSSRLAAPFIVLVFAGVFSSVSLLNSRQSKGVLAGVVMIALIFMSSVIGKQAYDDAVTLKRGVEPIEWQVAEDLRRFGVKSGDAIAVIGDSDRNAFWARLARVKIVAQVLRADDFWRADVITRTQVLKAMQNTGARAIVWDPNAELPEQFFSETGWRKLERSYCYVYLF